MKGLEEFVYLNQDYWQRSFDAESSGTSTSPDEEKRKADTEL